MARNRIIEIGEVRARKGRYGATFRAESEIDRIQSVVDQSQLPEEATFFPIRLVTSLEVYTREQVAKLIDHGEPYISRARELTVDFKFDYELTRALVGKSITFGELMSHAMPLNGVADLDKVFKTLLEKPLVLLLTGVSHSVYFDSEEAPSLPIISDVDEMKSILNDLFEVRHVLVHEMPETKPFTDDQLRGFSKSASDFTHAMNQVINGLLYGKDDLPQIELNQRAADKAKISKAELDALLERVDPTNSDARLMKAQAAWANYAEIEATFLSRMDLDRIERGSIAPLVYWSIADELVRERIAWIRRSYGEGWEPLD